MGSRLHASLPNSPRSRRAACQPSKMVAQLRRRSAARKTTMTPVITSLLDTDLYKFTMWQTMLHRHPQTQAEYSFVCRNRSAYPLSELLSDVDVQLDHLCSLRFGADE